MLKTTWTRLLLLGLFLFETSLAQNPGDPCILDLGFILDASGSITFAWPGVRQFVANVVRQVNVSADGSHIGVIKFGADSNVEFGFSEGQDKDAVINRVLNLAGPKPFANTQLHLGIKDANEKLFNNATGSYRTDPSVRKVVVIVTDGAQTPPGNPFVPANKL
ncbi:matrilin-4-like, partial [Porites lutea]|uniref:matrilin-4-like n=1 Tax=Porites lutea TaxID=51062 RepID=UPI003CC601FA